MRRKLDPAEHDAAESGIRPARAANSSQNSARNGAEPDIGFSGTLARASDMRAVVLTAVQRERFHALYREHFDRLSQLRRLGVADATVEMRCKIVVVLRRIGGFKGRMSRPGCSRSCCVWRVTTGAAGNASRANRCGRSLPAAKPVRSSRPRASSSRYVAWLSR
jgi:hypothetical protein